MKLLSDDQEEKDDYLARTCKSKQIEKKFIYF